VVHNLSGEAIDAGPYTIPAAAVEPILTSPGVAPPTLGAAGWTVRLPARSLGTWRLE
jgi:hypothetical protein